MEVQKNSLYDLLYTSNEIEILTNFFKFLLLGENIPKIELNSRTNKSFENLLPMNILNMYNKSTNISQELYNSLYIPLLISYLHNQQENKIIQLNLYPDISHFINKKVNYINASVSLSYSTFIIIDYILPTSKHNLSLQEYPYKINQLDDLKDIWTAKICNTSIMNTKARELQLLILSTILKSLNNKEITDLLNNEYIYNNIQKISKYMNSNILGRIKGDTNIQDLWM